MSTDKVYIKYEGRDTIFEIVAGKLVPDPRSVTFNIKQEGPNCFIPMIPLLGIGFAGLTPCHNMEKAQSAIRTWVCAKALQAKQYAEYPKYHEFSL